MAKKGGWFIVRGSRGNRVRRVVAVTMVLLCPSALLANPTGGTVVAGSATLSTNGNTLNVNTGTNQTIIDWGGFSIAGNETTNINQPGSGSTTLNRVTGGNVSEIYGTLNSNGTVLLINPNGVLIGAGGIVNTRGGFTASTLDVRNRDFLRGRAFRFRGGSDATVTNLGQITSDQSDIFLIARHVANNGTLTARNGTIGLAAGTDVTVRSLQSTSPGQQRLSVALDGATAVRSGTGVDNEGTIDAVKAELVANGNIYSLAVNNGGLIRATGAGTVGGQVWLLGHGGTVKNTGTLIAKNADGSGGKIETSGDTVSIAGTVRTGAGGSWLIDPTDLVIDAAAASTISASLEGGGSVDEQATHSITINSAIAWSGSVGTGGTLTLDAGTGSISINASITTGGTGGTGGLVLVCGAGYTLGGGAAINLATTSSLTINGHPYTILGDLDSLIAAINGNSAGYYALGSNVTALGTTYTTTPINSLSGVFDGLGHTITGLTIDYLYTTDVGLFRENSGTIRNVGLVDASVTGGDYVGGLVGYNAGTIASSYVAGSVNGGLIGAIGGLVGENDGTITSSYVTGSVSGEFGVYGGGNPAQIGGLVGYNNGGTITSSYMTGSVSGWNSVTIGGLVGQNDGTIASSYVAGSVSGGLDATLGGLVGYNTRTITSSYAAGSMSGGNGAYVGGLVGENDGTIISSYATGSLSGGGSSYIGGLVAYNYAATITSSYATGSVNAGSGSYVGGLVGYNDSGTITDSYWDKTTSGTNTGVGSGTATGVTGLTGDQMFLSSSYSANFLAAWNIVDGYTVPYLSWQSVVYGATSSALGTVTVSVNGTAQGVLANTSGTRYVAILDSALTSSDVVEASGASGTAAAVATGLTGNAPRLDLTADTLFVSSGSALDAAALSTLASTYDLSSFYTASGGNLTLAANLSLVSTGDITLGGVGGSAYTLTINSGGTATATGAVNVGSFVLDGGNWVQNAGGGILAAFSATNFTINGGTFLRVNDGDGIGTPYLLTDVYGLQGMNGFLSGNFTLANDIDASGTATWNSGAGFVPIGQSTVYSGVFDGAGHTINGLYVNDSADSYVGLFGQNNGAIRDIGLIGGSVTGTFSNALVGGLAGYNFGTITSSYATGSVSGVGGNSYVGGLVAYNFGTIASSYATGSASGGSGALVGGLVAITGGTITSSYATGNVSGGDGALVGGLVGENDGTITSSHATGGVSGGNNSALVGGLAGYNTATITSSYATGSVGGGNSALVGGLVGDNGGTITLSYATGSASGGNSVAVGGLVGENDDTIMSSYATGSVSGTAMELGGLAGYSQGTIASSYATGGVSGGNGVYIGGLVGYSNGTMTDSYWNTATSGTGIGTGGGNNTGETGLTTGQMFLSSSYSANFLAAWNIVDGYTVPYLTWQSAVYGSVGGTVGTVSVTVNGTTVTSSCSYVGSGSYYLILNTVLGASDTVVAVGTNTDAVAATVSIAPASALADLVGQGGQVGQVAAGSSAGLGSGPSFSLPDGSTVTIPTSVFSPGGSVFAAPAGDGGSKHDGPSAFGGGGSSAGRGGALAASSGVAYSN